MAAGDGNYRAIEILLEFGADPFREDSEGRTAKFYAFDWDRRNSAPFEKCEALLSEAMERLTLPDSPE